MIRIVLSEYGKGAMEVDTRSLRDRPTINKTLQPLFKPLLFKVASCAMQVSICRGQVSRDGAPSWPGKATEPQGLRSKAMDVTRR